MLGYCIATPYWRASALLISDNTEITEVCGQTENSADKKKKIMPILEIQWVAINSFPGVYQLQNHTKTGAYFCVFICHVGGAG